MSVTFSIEGVAVDYDDDRTYLNLASVNARDLLDWLGYDVGAYLGGTLDPRDLAARCRRRLWDEARNHDPPVPAQVLAAGRAAIFGRRQGYLRDRCRDLLGLAEAACDRPIRVG